MSRCDAFPTDIHVNIGGLEEVHHRAAVFDVLRQPLKPFFAFVGVDTNTELDPVEIGPHTLHAPTAALVDFAVCFHIDGGIFEAHRLCTAVDDDAFAAQER